MSAYFPVALDLGGRRCLLVGGGVVAQRKLEALVAGGADDVVVVAPSITPGVNAITDEHGFELRGRAFEAQDLEGVFLAMVATDDPGVNGRVATAARARGVLVNAADDPAHCDFILPAVVRRGDVQVAVTTGGRSPALARHLREWLEAEVPKEYGALLDIIAAIRGELRREGQRVDAERWQRAIGDEALRLLRGGDIDAAERLVRERLGDGAGNPQMGRIVLVGAGPGDPGLITVAGRRAIAEGDVIVYDRLVNACLLEDAPPEARRIYAGKRPGGGGPFSQDEINALLCAEAQAGRVVVRLKGGDPFVFGRGGEEALAAAQAGVPFTIIPGVTAAVAVPAYAGIPVTHRDLASAFTVVTGHQGDTRGWEARDWEALARVGGTLIFLMGVETLGAIARHLMGAGLPPLTPAAVLESGTTPAQKVVLGTLGDIAERAEEMAIGAPATTVIGPVAALAPQLAWFGTSRNIHEGELTR